MASTPPAQIRVEARTPPTPLHGSAYYTKTSPSRYNTRSNAQKTPGSVDSTFTQSPPPNLVHSPQPQSRNSHFHSQSTPKRKSTRVVQVISPTSPDSDSNLPIPSQPQNPSYLSATTIMSEGMLPTPVKTPQKNKEIKPNMAARALFQDQLNPIASPRKSAKKRRYNGFSLESFAENGDQNSIPIFTDSRDNVPEVDPSEDNPFYTKPEHNNTATSSSAQKTKRSAKRRKISTEKKPLDPQVEDAIKNDEGMVYVFRGKKVFRRFDDFGDEEEVIDPEELGLLQYQRNGTEVTSPLKTLTRKSIKPRRLFQTTSTNNEDNQNHLQAPKASQSDEEADTEIEEDHDHNLNISDHEQEQELQQSPTRGAATRSRAQKSSSSNATKVEAKKSSPFDSWKRMKSGGRPASASVPAASAKGRKRTAAEALEVQ